MVNSLKVGRFDGCEESHETKVTLTCPKLQEERVISGTSISKKHRTAIFRHPNPVGKGDDLETSIQNLYSIYTSGGQLVARCCENPQT